MTTPGGEKSIVVLKLPDEGLLARTVLLNEKDGPPKEISLVELDTRRYDETEIQALDSNPFPDLHLTMLEEPQEVARASVFPMPTWKVASLAIADTKSTVTLAAPETGRLRFKMLLILCDVVP